jgi:hypothetical protein
VTNGIILRLLQRHREEEKRVLKKFFLEEKNKDKELLTMVKIIKN